MAYFLLILTNCVDSTLNCEMWPNFSYRGVRLVQLLLLLLLLMVFSSENFGFSPPYAGIAGIGPAKNSGSKQNRRETESVPSKHPYA